MGVPERVLAVLGVGLVPADSPILRGDDLGVVRGDGIFETMHVRGGQPWKLDAHLARMRRSAALMDLPLPPVSAITELVARALTAWPTDVEGALRIVCTRGPEDGGDATLFATVFPVSAGNLSARSEGVRVATASLGFPAQLRPETPWLLGGAKTLSYAVNMASLRWAKTVGADDVLWVSSDGFALEAPTASLVWLDGKTLRTVPPASTGVLAGTTAAYLLAHAADLGLEAGEGLISAADLACTGGAWLTSSVRGLAAIRVLDGIPLPYNEDLTTRIRTLLGFPLR